MNDSSIKKISHSISVLLNRSALIAVSGFITTMLVIRWIGIEQYGYFAGAFAVVMFTELVLKSEIKSFLVRHDRITFKKCYDTVFSVLLFLSIMVLILFFLVKSLLTLYVDLQSEYLTVFISLSCLLPLALTVEVPRATLEREMKMDVIARQETFSSISQQVVTLMLAIIFKNYWALVCGWITYNVFISVLSWRSAAYRPAMSLDSEILQGMKYHYRHVVTQSILSESHKLVNPLLVGTFWNPVSVGAIAFTEKIVFGFTFLVNTFKRVFNGALSDTETVNRRDYLALVSEYSFILTLLLASALLGIGVIWPYIGRIIQIQQFPDHLFGLLSASALLMASTSVISTFYLITGRLKALTIQLTIQTGILWISAPILIIQFGILGYGIAFCIAGMSRIYLLMDLSGFMSSVNGKKTLLLLMVFTVISIYWL